MSDFWNNLLTGSHLDEGGTGSIDSYLTGKPIGGDSYNSVRNLTDKMRPTLELPVMAGARVAFVANMGSVLAYTECPADKALGTVVNVKSAGGEITSHEGKVFVQWDTGSFLPIYAEHLRQADGQPKVQQKTGHQSIRVASLSKVSNYFLKVSEETLIHRSTRDLWSFRKDGEEFVIERLFDGAGGPLKG